MEVSNDAILPGCFIGLFQVKEEARCGIGSTASKENGEECGIEYRMLPRVQCCWGIACACRVRVLWWCRNIPRNREIWGASFVFWPGSADCVDVCSWDTDSQWHVVSVVCATGDKVCRGSVDRILSVALPSVSGASSDDVVRCVFVCNRESH